MVLSHFLEDADAHTLATKIEAAIKAKAPQEEVQNILKEVSDEEQTEQYSPLKVLYKIA